MLEVGPLLQGLWTINPRLDFSFEKEPWSRHRPALFVGVDSATMTKVVQSLLKGDLGAKRYSRLLRSVGLTRAGSGGIFFWDSLDRWHEKNPHTEHCSSLQQPFGEADNGGQLRLLPSPKLKLFDLPDPVLERIFDLVLPNCGIKVLDVDNDTNFHDGLIHMDRWLYNRFGCRFFEIGSFRLVLATRSNSGQFPGLVAFQKILRKPGPHIGTGRIGRSCKGRQLVYGDYHVELNFILNDTVSLVDVRTDIFPIVMESSTAEGDHRVTFRLSHIDDNGALTEIGVHHTTQRKLRTNIAKALVDVEFSREEHTHPEIWINRFGDVLDAAEQSNLERLDCMSTATRLIAQQGNHRVDVLHPLDHYYRSDEGLQYDSRCTFKDLDQFFPFHGVPDEMLHYLHWVLKAEGKRHKS